MTLRLDHRRATQIAVAIRRGLTLLCGLAGFATRDFFLFVIFFWFGASAEGQQVAVDDVLGGATVGQAMIQRPQILAATDPPARGGAGRSRG